MNIYKVNYQEIKQLYKEREDISRKIYNLKRDKMKIYEKFICQ